MSKRLFSVLSRHDELPEMTLPLALLLMFLTAAFSAAAGRLASFSDPTPASPENLVGVAASFPFLAVAVCLYALIILLWRRIASLLATPLSFAAMLLGGTGFFPACALSLILLFTAYVFATSMIARENRFVRLFSLSFAYAVSLGLTAVAWIGLHFDGFGGFSEAYMRDIPTLIGTLYAAYSGSALALPQVTLNTLARNFLIMCPAYLGALSILLAWMTDYLAAAAFRALSAEGIFIDTSRRITMPFSFAAIYASVLLLTLFTSSEGNPLLYVLLRSLFSVMILPCAAVGVHGLFALLEEKLYYLTREKLLAFLILVFAFALLGASVFLLVTPIIGAGAVIRRKLLSGSGTEQT